MFAGFFIFSAADAQSKLLTETLHTAQIVWARYAGLATAALILLGLNGPAILKTDRPVVQLLRGSVGVLSALCFVFALAYVPLADAVAIAFVAPFMVTIMGAVILKEPVGLRRWVAVVIGFCGALVIIRPGFGVIHPAATLVVVAAALFAVRQIISRWLSDTDTTATTVAYTAIAGFGLTALTLPFVWQTPATTREIALLAGLAACAALGEALIIKALEVAQAVVLAPLQYTKLVASVVYGYVLFNELPDGWTLLGAAIIIAAGFYTLNRERIVSRERVEAGGR